MHAKLACHISSKSRIQGRALRNTKDVLRAVTRSETASKIGHGKEI